MSFSPNNVLARGGVKDFPRRQKAASFTIDGALTRWPGRKPTLEASSLLACYQTGAVVSEVLK